MGEGLVNVMVTQSGPGSLQEEASKEAKHAVWGHLTQGVPTVLPLPFSTVCVPAACR